MEWSIKFSDVVIVMATLLGPVLAIQVQKYLERGREQNQRRLGIFRTLMATRGSVLSPNHVEALNVVPIEFAGKREPFVAVVNAWKAYIHHLYQDVAEDRSWSEKRVEKLDALLLKLSAALGYNFNSVEISRELYVPKAYAAVENENDIIRRGLAAVFRGEKSIPMDVRSFPTDPVFLGNQHALQQYLLEWLDGKRIVKVTSTTS